MDIKHEIIESISVGSSFGEKVLDVSPHDFDLYGRADRQTELQGHRSQDLLESVEREIQLLETS